MLQYDIFIDESGIFRDSGFSIYCLTICEHRLSESLDKKIIDIENKIKTPPFHWRNHVWKIKTKFLNEIIKIEDWNSILVVISNKNYTYSLFEELLSKALQGLDIKRMYIDGKKHKDYVNSVKKSLKNVGIKINELKMVRHQTKSGLIIS